MITYEIGSFVKSLAGHDKDKVYVIMEQDSEYIYLSDGTIRSVSKFKRKKRKHVQWIDHKDENLVRKFLKEEPIRDEDVKRAVKSYNQLQARK